MRLADAISRCLLELGVEYLFGVSGANIEHLHDAIHRLADGRLRSILARSESGAAFMADGYARTHRRLGVCCATSGGGMLNLLAGIAESHAESVPVLALVGQPPLASEGRGAFQDSSGVGRTVHALRLWSACSKITRKLTRPEDAFEAIADCVTTALRGRPGPAVLLIPRDAYEWEVGELPAGWLASIEASCAVPPAEDEQVRALHRALRDAKNPVLIVGHGVQRSRNGTAVARFARNTQIPTATTLGARGCFTAEPSHLGAVGQAGHPSAHRYINEHADLIVAVGTGLGAMSRGAIERALRSKPLFVLDVDVSDLRRNFPNAAWLEADAGEAFVALNRVWEAAPVSFASAPRAPRTVFFPSLAEPSATLRSPELPLRQSRALAMLNPFLPEDGHLFFDAGNCAAAALHYGVVPKGTSSTIALGMGGMGYAVGGAIGAQLGGGSRTVAMVGDGAFLISGFEIHAAVQLGLPILFVVFNNGAHGMCVTRQDLYFEGRRECASYPRVDVAAVARGMGPPEALWVGKANSEAELGAALADQARHAELPGVLELGLSVEEMPPFSPFLAPDAMTLSFEQFQSLAW